MRIKKIAMFLLTVTLAGTAVMPANAAESANIEEMSAEQFLDAENVDNYATEDAADEEEMSAEQFLDAENVDDYATEDAADEMEILYAIKKGMEENGDIAVDFNTQEEAMTEEDAGKAEEFDSWEEGIGETCVLLQLNMQNKTLAGVAIDEKEKPAELYVGEENGEGAGEKETNCLMADTANIRGLQDEDEEVYVGKIIAGTGAEREIIMQVNEDGSFLTMPFSENTYAMSQSKCQHYQWIQVSEAKPVKNSARIVGSKKVCYRRAYSAAYRCKACRMVRNMKTYINFGHNYKNKVCTKCKRRKG